MTNKADRLDELLAARGRATPEDLGLSPSEALRWAEQHPGVEAVFLVRLRSLVGSVRVEEVRAEAWPARREAERDEGFFAEDARLLRFEPRLDVPFPLCLHAEPSQTGPQTARFRRALRMFVRATALAASRLRRAELALRGIEPLFEEISASAAGAMWIEAARLFRGQGDLDHARRALSQLSALARRARVREAELVRAVLAKENASIIPLELVEVAALCLEPQEALALHLGALRSRLEAGERVPAGTIAALDAAARSTPDAANGGLLVDASLLGMMGLAGTWSAEGEATLVHARLAELCARAHEPGEEGPRHALVALIRSTLAHLDRPGLARLLETLLATDARGDADLLLDAASRLLGAMQPGRTSREEDAALRALRHVAETNPHALVERQGDLSRALASAFVLPEQRPLLTALVADIEAATNLSGLSLGEAERGAPPRAGSRVDRERALGRWIPSSLLASTRAALLAPDSADERAPLFASPETAFVVAIRLIGLAQDEDSPTGLAEDALSLAEALADAFEQTLPDHRLSIAAVDPTLHLARPDPRAIRSGVALSRAYLSRRSALRPERWPAPPIDALSDPRDARFVLLAWALGGLDTQEARANHLAFTRIAAATPLVHATPGKLSPSPRALRGHAPSALPSLASHAIARAKPPREANASLRDVVLLCPPLDLANAFATDLGAPPLDEACPDEPNLDRPAPAEPRSKLVLPAPELDPARTLLASLSPPSASVAFPERDPALPLPAEIARHAVSLDARGDLVVLGSRGAPLRRVPEVVRKDEAYRALTRGRRAERVRRRRAILALEERMTSAHPFRPDELQWLFTDPLHASLLRGLVIAVTLEGARSIELPFSLLWAWDDARGVGVVPLDYDARWFGRATIEIVHPSRLPDLQAYRALVLDLDVRQGVSQLFRDIRSVPDEDLSRDRSFALAGRPIGGARTLFRALFAEGFDWRKSVATRVFFHRDLAHPVELWFEMGPAGSGDDAAISGAFGFRDLAGRAIPFAAIPRALACEARVSLERALARAAPRER